MYNIYHCVQFVPQNHPAPLNTRARLTIALHSSPEDTDDRMVALPWPPFPARTFGARQPGGSAHVNQGGCEQQGSSASATT